MAWRRRVGGGEVRKGNCFKQRQEEETNVENNPTEGEIRMKRVAVLPDHCRVGKSLTCSSLGELINGSQLEWEALKCAATVWRRNNATTTRGECLLTNKNYSKTINRVNTMHDNPQCVVLN